MTQHAELPAPKARLNLRQAAGLAALALLALGLRVWGLSWGLPNAGRYYPYHPDESVLLQAVSNLNPLWGDFDPSFFNYGSFYLILCRLAYDLTAPFLGWGGVPQPFDPNFPHRVADFAHVLLVGRWVAVLLGVGTVLLTYHLGRRLYSERAGWIAAGFLALAPMPVLLGHYMAVDVPTAFFTTATLLYAAGALRAADTKQAGKLLIIAGAMTGLAIGTKYSSFPVAFSLLVPAWQLSRSGAPGAKGKAIGALAAAGAACVVAFLLATPGALSNSSRFLADVLLELGLNKEGQGMVFKATPPAMLYHLGISLPVGLEWPLYLLCLGGFAVSLRQRKPEDVLLWLFILPYFLLLAPAERKYLRYVVPLVPPLLLLAARWIDTGLAGRRAGVWAAVGAVAGCVALASTVAHLGLLTAEDPRDAAAAYLKQQAKPEDIVALGADPFFYTPPIHPATGTVKRALFFGGPPIWDAVPEGQVRPEVFQLPEFRVLSPSSLENTGPLPVAQLEKHHPRFVILSDYEYEDPERIRRADPSFTHGILELETVLGKEYHLAKEFRPRPSLLGFTWWRSGIPPHDWRYYMPTVRIWERNP